MRIIDLSHELSESTPPFPGDPPVRLTQQKSIESDFFNAYTLETGMHTGTHIDMPMHLTRDARAVCDFPVERFAGRGVLLDVRGERMIGMRPEYRERVGAGDVVLLHTGFDARFGSAEYFSAHPSVGRDFAEFLLEARVKMLGLDMPSPDTAPYEMHRLLLENGVFILENLTNLSALAGVRRFDVMALPLKIRAEASLVRAVGIVLE